MARSASIISLVRLPRVPKSRPSASNSSRIQPTPMPSATRPLEIWAAVATVFATSSTWRSGRM